MEKSIMVNLGDFAKLKTFIDKVSSFESDIDLISGRHSVNAKSVMGIYSLDLSMDLCLKIFTEDEAEIARFVEEMEEFRV